MFRTGIIIVAHNSAGHIGACVDAVNRVRGAQDVVLVIDNASSDQMPPFDSGTPVRLIRNAHNAGFAGAVNQGFETLKNDVDAVLLLNPDVVLTTRFDALAEACQRAGLAGGCLADEQGNPQVGFSFRRFPGPWTLFFETIGLNRIWKSNPVNRRYRCLDAGYTVSQTVDQPAGAMLMIRKDVWQQLNGFDERFHPVAFFQYRRQR